jgi:hypothetical protein
MSHIMISNLMLCAVHMNILITQIYGAGPGIE